MNITKLIVLTIFLTNASFGMENNPQNAPAQQIDNYWKETGEKWGFNLRIAIREQDLVSLARLLEDRSLRETFRDELNISFVESSWKNTEKTNLEMLKLFLKYPEVDINYYDNHFGAATVLISAVLSDQLETVKFLLAQPGIDINIKGNSIFDKTALQYAQTSKSSIANRQEIIKLLKNHNKYHGK